MIGFLKNNFDLWTQEKHGSFYKNTTIKKTIRNSIKQLALVFVLANTMTAIADTDTKATVYKFDISSEDMASALNKLAETTNTELSYPASLVKGVKSKGLKGNYTQEQALQQLLKGSGLSYQKTANNAITVKKSTLSPAGKSVAGSASGDTTLATMTVSAKADKNYYTPDNPDYSIPDASTATKTDTPIIETPYSVKVVPQQVLKDQQAIRVEDAIQNVAGVQSSYTNGGLSDVFIMRGFQSTNLYRDGFLLPSALGGGTSKRQMANLDHIEVLKGPGSILYGRNEPGGVINLITKRPQATSYNAIQQQFGSYGFYRTTVDSTGAVPNNDRLLYRVNLSYENAGSFRDYVKTDDVFFAPSLTWNVSNKTQINMDITYEHFNNTSDSGIPPIGNRPAPVPRNTQAGDPLNNKNVGDRTYVGFDWSHKFNDDWKLTHRFGAEFLDLQQDFTFYFQPATIDGNLVNIDANGNGNRGFNNSNVQQQEYYTTLNLTGKLKTGVLEHTTLWGFDYFVIDNQSSGYCCSAFPMGANFNVFNPSYQTTKPSLDFTPYPNYTQDWYGLYFQDQIKFPFNIHGNVGVRYDNATGSNNGITTTSDNHVSPRGGLLWQPKKWLSFYGNYSENFGISNSLYNTPGQQILPPMLANEWELGTKTELFGGRLLATFAYFDLIRNNVAVSDPVNPMLQKTIGEQETRGFEFELAGEALPGWRVLAAYTNLAYAKVNNDVGFDGGPGNTGNRMFNTPRNFGSFWNTYEFQNAKLRGLKVGGGIYASQQSQGTNDNTFQLPGYVTLNMMASYGMKVAGKKVTLQLNANNLLDKTYYTGTNMSTMIGVGAPRSFMGSIKLEF